MKKTFRIRMTILAIVIVSILSFLMYKIITNDNIRYEVTKVKEYNYFVLKQNDFYGIIDKKGNIIINTEYTDIKIPNPEKAVFVCYKDNSVKVLNDKNQEILDNYDKVEAITLKNVSGDLIYEKSVLKYFENGKYGLINFNGKRITKAIYDDIDSIPYKEGELLVKKNEKYGILTIRGKKIVDIKYDNITVDGYYTQSNQYRNAGYIVSNKTDEGYRYGYVNYKGRLIESVEYNELSRVTGIDDNNIYIICAKNGQYGISKNGKELIKNEYQSITFDESNNLFIIEKSKKYGITNLSGEVIVPVEYNQIDITGIYLYAKDNQGTTVYNSEGNQVNIDIDIAILNTANEKYKIRINSSENTKYGLIGKDGRQIIEEKYNYMEYLYDNYFIVSNENSKLGIIDDKENEKVEIKYDSVQKLQDSNIIQTTIVETSTTELYSKALEKICEMKNATIDVKENYIEIYNEEEIKYFGKDGNELKNIQIYPINKLFAKENDGKWGFVDANENLVVDYKYEKVTEFNEYGYAGIKLEGKWGVIDEQGNEIQSPIYDLKDEQIPSFIAKYYKLTYGFGEFYYTDDNN